MKFYEIIGYTANAEILCLFCARKEFTSASLAAGTATDAYNDDVNPIFAGNEAAEEAHCACCGIKLIEAY